MEKVGFKSKKIKSLFISKNSIGEVNTWHYELFHNNIIRILIY